MNPVARILSRVGLRRSPVKIGAALAVVAMLAGCQTADVGPVDTTGHQATVVTAAPVSTIQEVLVYQAINNRGQVLSQTPTMLVIDARPNDFLYIMTRKSWDPAARARVTYLFSQKDGRTVVTANASLVTNRGGPTQEVMDFNNDPDVAAGLQRRLAEAVAKAS
ncbi:hypothetical protein [Microvirga antarctica]|uniref:hypothetical protein n=1 Tax=Microvirga antarctica TaxID=2819233 RepID=UPI001B3170FB|nr:hypothetical protein [Microvirga antarctica]